MIYLTGDCHGEFYKFNKHIFPAQSQLTRNDVVIILGDFGLIWSSKETPAELYTIDYLESLPFTILFIDGNHENFKRLNSYPIEERYGGKVHVIRPNILHLMRGEVFEICGKKIFAFGGASSHDVQDGILDSADPNWKDKAKRIEKTGRYMYRVKDISWWEEELPTIEEMQNGRDNLKKHNKEVDYIISHTPPTEILRGLSRYSSYKKDILTDYLDEIRLTTKYKKHFMGHMHVDNQINDKDCILYNEIIKLD